MTDEKLKEQLEAPAKKDSPDAASRPVTSRPISRRGFIKTATVATAAIATSAGIAKTVSSFIPGPNYQSSYNQDETTGDRILAKTRLVEMTDSDKREFERDFIKTYRYTDKA